MTTPPHAYGPEYPAYLTWMDGTRMALVRESRWSRTYRHPTKKLEHVCSRFEDGSASITFDELSATWSGWTRAERSDFCYNCSLLRSQADFAEILRFILREGDWNDWCGIASCLADVLPCQEAFDLLSQALELTPVEHSSNLVQAILVLHHRTSKSRFVPFPPTRARASDKPARHFFPGTILGYHRRNHRRAVPVNGGALTDYLGAMRSTVGK